MLIKKESYKKLEKGINVHIYKNITENLLRKEINKRLNKIFILLTMIFAVFPYLIITRHIITYSLELNIDYSNVLVINTIPPLFISFSLFFLKERDKQGAYFFFITLLIIILVITISNLSPYADKETYGLVKLFSIDNSIYAVLYLFAIPLIKKLFSKIEQQGENK